MAGKNARDENGLTEEEYLKKYKPGKYERPSVTVDMLLFGMDEHYDSLKLLLIRRKNHPFINKWAFPGGFVNIDESAYHAACRELEEETGLSEAKMAHSGLLSCETLTVDGHWKRGAYVPSHLHLNATYLFEASEEDALRIAPEENSGVRWLTFEEALTASTEPWMVEHVYCKLIERSK